MNQFSTLAIFLCATLALGSCSGGYGGGHHGGAGGYGGQGHRELSSYGQRESGGGAAAASAAAAAPVEIIAGGPRYGGSEQLRPILLDSGYGNSGSQYGQGQGHGSANIYGAQQQQSYGAPQQSYGGHQQQSYGGHQQQSYGAPQQSYGGQQRGYGGRPRWSVQPAGATVLYPGQNSYRKYASAPEYTKVLLPVRAAPPVAKLYIPENNYGNQGGYQAEQSSY